MKKWIILLVLLVAGNAYAASGALSWIPNDDGGITKGYEVLWGHEPRNYTTVSPAGMPELVDGRHFHTVHNLPEGEPLFFAAIAYDDSGDTIVKSDYSNEVEHIFPVTGPVIPGIPAGLEIIVTTVTTIQIK